MYVAGLVEDQIIVYTQTFTCSLKIKVKPFLGTLTKLKNHNIAIFSSILNLDRGKEIHYPTVYSFIFYDAELRLPTCGILP